MNNSSKILITGSAGFIGSHLVEECVKSGYNVKAFVRYNSKNHWGWLESIDYKKEIEIFNGDIRDYDSVSKAVKDVDAIFHLAALIGIPYSYLSPVAYIKTNVEGTYNILQAAKEHGTNNVLVTSTSETYGSAQYIPIDEQHPFVGQSPYSASKIAADQLAISYYRSFGLPIKIVRPFNTFGPRQSARAIIPTIITQILDGIQELKLGNLLPTRDFTFVKDTVQGFMEIFRTEKLFGEMTNIGMNHSVSMEELVKMIARLMDVDVKICGDEKRIRPSTSEVERLLCNNKKLITNTNWKPKYTLETGLNETIGWLKEHREYYKSGVYNV